MVIGSSKGNDPHRLVQFNTVYMYLAESSDQTNNIATNKCPHDQIWRHSGTDVPIRSLAPGANRRTANDRTYGTAVKLCSVIITDFLLKPW